MAKKYELQSKRSVTVPVEIDGAAYQASVDVVAVMAATRPIVETIGRLQESVKGTGADLEEDMGMLDEQVRELVRTVFGEGSVETILGAEPVGVILAGSVMAIVNDIVTGDEYHQALTGAFGGR